MLKRNTRTSMNIPKVVILGGGYAGSLLAQSLEKEAQAGRISVTIVDRRPSCHLKIGAIRASVRGGEWTERTRVPLSQVLKYGRVVVGEVKEIDPINKLVLFKEEEVEKKQEDAVDVEPATEPLPYDILVCATGACNHSPGDLPSNVQTREDILAYFKEIAEAIRSSENILIVGGGASAVEYAGEIRDVHPEKPITIVASSLDLLSSSVAPMSEKFMKSLYKTIEQRDIKLIRGEKVVQPTEADWGQRKFLKGPIKVKTMGQQNLELETDLLIWAATWKMNSSIYPDTWLNEIGELNTSRTFQLHDRGDVFAFGDVTSIPETKQAITLPKKTALIKENILKVAQAIASNKFDPHYQTKGLKSYKVTDKVTMYLPVGRDFGVTQEKSSVYGDKYTSKKKGGDLYSGYFWGLLTGGPAPRPTGYSVTEA